MGYQSNGRPRLGHGVKIRTHRQRPLVANLVIDNLQRRSLLQVDVLCGAGVLQMLLVVLLEGPTNTLCYRSH